MPYLKPNEVVTPALFARYVAEIKEAVLVLVRGELVPPAPAPPNPAERIPLVINRRVIDASADAWADKLKSPRHVETQPSGDGENEETVPRVHAYMVGFGGLETGGADGSVGHGAFKLRLIIDSYYEDDFGSDADNAEQRHAAEVHRLAYLFLSSHTLFHPGVLKVGSFTERRGFSRMGETRIVRESLAELILELRAVPLVRPEAPAAP